MIPQTAPLSALGAPGVTGPLCIVLTDDPGEKGPVSSGESV